MFFVTFNQQIFTGKVFDERYELLSKVWHGLQAK